MNPDEMRAQARDLRSTARLYLAQALNLDREAKVVELSEALDHLKVPRAAGRTRIVKELRDRGWTLDNELANDIARHRKEYR